jgi:hypothetical protein
MALFLDSEIPGYDLCCTSCGCNADPRPEDGKRWCDNSEDCADHKECGCHLFKRRRRITGNTPNPWEHVANPGVEVDAILDTEHDYMCICVKRKAS